MDWSYTTPINRPRYLSNSSRSAASSRGSIKVNLKKAFKKAARDFVKTKTSRPRKKVSYKTDGIAAGRLTTRKKRRSTRSAILRDGYSTTLEYGKIYSGADLVGVGHITHPSTVIAGNVFGAVFKKLMNMAGVQVYRNDVSLPFIVGDTLVISYRTEDNATPGSVSYSFAIGNTMLSVIGWFLDPARPWANIAATSQFSFLTMVFKSALGTINNEINSMSLALPNVSVKCLVKSTLKIQNRTVNSIANVEADDVDNAPVYGKIYSGVGTGADYLSLSAPGGNISFYGDVANGVISPANVNSLGEPPFDHSFSKVSRSGKILLNPGQIKTSSLSHTKTMTFNDWIRSMSYIGDSAIALGKNGKFAFMMIEKLIDASLTQPLSVATEHNLEVSTSVSVRKSFQMARGYKKVYG